MRSLEQTIKTALSASTAGFSVASIDLMLNRAAGWPHGEFHPRGTPLQLALRTALRAGALGVGAVAFTSQPATLHGVAGALGYAVVDDFVTFFSQSSAPGTGV